MSAEVKAIPFGNYSISAKPRFVPLYTTDSYATITTAGYLNKIKDQQFFSGDVVSAYYGTGINGLFSISIDSSGIITLAPLSTAGEVSLIGSAVSGNIPKFSGTTGDISDSLASLSDSTKTKIVMAGSATVLNRIAHFIDTSGTIDDTAAAVTNAGDIYAGASAISGLFRSYPSAATSGYLGLTGVANSGDFSVQIANVSHAQNTIHSIVDPGNAAARFLVAATATPFVSGNFPIASGTGGLMIDSGFNINNIELIATVAVSSSEFNGMYAAPKLVIAAPGANKLILVSRAVLIMTYNSAAYAAGGNVAFQYDSTVHAAGTWATNDEQGADFQAASSRVFSFNGADGDSSAFTFTTSVNKALYLTNDTAAFTTGNSTFVAKIYYRIIDVV